MKKQWIILLAALLCLICLCGVAVAEEAASDHGDPSNLKDWDAYEPKIVTMENGVRVQTVPDAGEPAWDWNWYSQKEGGWKYYNTYFLNAQNRGCTACHTLQWAMKQINHCIYEGSYPTDTMSYQTCIGCHSETYSGMNLMQPIHTTHLRSEAFDNMGGTCESCHYITYDGEFQRWDMVKYDVMAGTTPVASSDLNYTLEWNQTEITPNEYVFGSKWGNSYGWGMTENNAFGYTFDYLDQFKSEDYRDTWKLVIGGDVAKPGEYSINELIEACGSVTKTWATQCTINGNGCSFVYQTEMTGIPVEKILEFVGAEIKEDSVVCPLGYDCYYYAMTVPNAIKEEAMLVYEMNGETLSDIEGFPLMYQAKHISAGNKTRTVVELDVFSGEDTWCLGEYYGDFTDDYTGELICKPNMGVLNTYNGTIFTPGETVHLEGYASAFEEPIRKIEFSLDKGETWFGADTEEADSDRWVYWKLDLNDLPEGAYILTLRATSLNDETGELRVQYELPKFLINVK